MVSVTGFLCEAIAVKEQPDITAYGGWRRSLEVWPSDPKRKRGRKQSQAYGKSTVWSRVSATATRNGWTDCPTTSVFRFGPDSQ